MKCCQLLWLAIYFEPPFTVVLDIRWYRALVVQTSRRHKNNYWSPLGRVEACAFTKHKVEALIAKASGLFLCAQRYWEAIKTQGNDLQFSQYLLRLGSLLPRG
jgi:hypothetical protein